MPPTFGRIKRALSLPAWGWLLLGVLALPASPTAAQAPDEAWRTIETEHFRVTFPESLEDLGRRAADRAEWAWRELARSLIDPPEDVVDVLVTDHTDTSNGFARLTPSSRITIIARPPVDALSLGHTDEWLEMVILHELAHVVHLDHTANWMGRLGRAVFGRVPSEWPLFPGFSTPSWLIEGLATWYESRLTSAGRVRGTFEEMQLRSAMLEGRFETLGQASGQSPVWPGGNRRYAYGSMFFEFLANTYGEESIPVFVEAVAGQWVPYRIDAAARKAFGVSVSDAWDQWRSAIEEDIRTLDDRLLAAGSITDPEQVTRGARWALHAVPSPDGRSLAYTRSDGRSDMQVRILDLASGEERGLGWAAGLPRFDWTPDGSLIVSQLEFSGPYRTLSDLYRIDPDGATTRLTHGARLDQPSVAPDGSEVVAVRQGGGTTALAIVDLETGAVRDLVVADPDVHWAHPSWAPNGRWIAATRWEPGARHDVVVLDATTGALVARVTDDRALDMAPSWSPDGRSLVWSSDRTGIFNVLGATIDPNSGSAGTPYLVTNVRTGAVHPRIDPSGSSVFVAGYGAEGWDVQRVPFDVAADRPAPQPVDRFVVSSAPPSRGLAGGDVQPYRPGSTVWPRAWQLEYLEADRAPANSPDDLLARDVLEAGVGLSVESSDLVGRHAYAATAYGRQSGQFEGAVAYGYYGFGNPTISVSAGQRYRAGTQQVVPTTLDTLVTRIQDRYVDGSVTYRIPRWRRQLALSLGGGLDWERLELLDPALRVDPRYRLVVERRRIAEGRATVSFSSLRSHDFQLGAARGFSVYLQGRLRTELTLPDSLNGVVPFDRSLGEVVGRVRAAIPLWRFGFARHTLALHATGAVAAGPGSTSFPYRPGGASGRPETITGLQLFGGSYRFFPIRGYDPAARFGNRAWSASAEYRFPIGLIHRGLGPWPLHLDRVVGSLFFDAGNAWGPAVGPTGFQNPRGSPLASVGAEVTAQLLTWYDMATRLRLGVAMPLREGNGAVLYLRTGLSH